MVDLSMETLSIQDGKSQRRPGSARRSRSPRHGGSGSALSKRQSSPSLKRTSSHPGQREAFGSSSTGGASSSRLVPGLDMAGAAAAERKRGARKHIEICLSSSSNTKARRRPAPAAGMTARDVLTERQNHAKECQTLAAELQAAVQDGIDQGVPDELLESGVQRILELEACAAEEVLAAQNALEARAALRATPIKTPVTRTGSNAARRAAAAARCPLGEGSLVQLKGLDSVIGLTGGVFDVDLGEYNGRKGRVSKEPPPWVIKAIPVGAAPRGGTAAACDGEASDRTRASIAGGSLTGTDPSVVASATASRTLNALEDLSDASDGPIGLTAAAQPIAGLELIPVLLDSRHGDVDRFRGVWVAVPAANLKVLQQ